MPAPFPVPNVRKIISLSPDREAPAPNLNSASAPAFASCSTNTGNAGNRRSSVRVSGTSCQPGKFGGSNKWPTPASIGPATATLIAIGRRPTDCDTEIVCSTRSARVGNVSTNGRAPFVGMTERCRISPPVVPSTIAVFVPPTLIPIIVGVSTTLMPLISDDRNQLRWTVGIRNKSNRRRAAHVRQRRSIARIERLARQVRHGAGTIDVHHSDSIIDLAHGNRRRRGYGRDEDKRCGTMQRADPHERSTERDGVETRRLQTARRWRGCHGTNAQFERASWSAEPTRERPREATRTRTSQQEMSVPFDVGLATQHPCVAVELQGATESPNRVPERDVPRHERECQLPECADQWITGPTDALARGASRARGRVWAAPGTTRVRLCADGTIPRGRDRSHR